MSTSQNDDAQLCCSLERHRPDLLAMLRRRLPPALRLRVDPEDILAESFLIARRRLPKAPADVPDLCYAWWYRLARDCLIEAWRRESRECRDLSRGTPWPADSAAQLELGLVATGTTPSDAAGRRQLADRMRQALATLSDNDREVLWMRHYDQLSHRQIAVVLGVSENTATVRYVRALTRLKDVWRQLFGEQDEL